jgi:methionine sulfoxide reductase heme-binding subunit
MKHYRLIWWIVWLVCAAPLFQFVYLGFAGGLTANPVEYILRHLGVWALRLILVGLAITPLARILKMPVLIRYRRLIGLWAFAFVVLHLSVYIGIDRFFNWNEIVKDVLKRPYITFGMLAFALLIPLAVTSTNGMIRRVGPKTWRRIHQAIYVIAPLGVLHYYLLVKADHRPPLAYAAILAVLLGYRVMTWVMRERKRARPVSAQTVANDA